MTTKIRSLLTAAITLAALAALVSSAAAATIAIAPAGEIRATSLNKLTFQAGSNRIECNVSLEGNLLAGPITKATTEKIGEINAVEVANCVGGEVVETALTLPWQINYTSIAGTLPEAVTSVLITLRNVSFRLSGFAGVECLYQGDVGASIELTRIGAGRYTSGLATLLGNQLRKAGGSSFCPREATMIGRFGLTPALTLTRA